MYSLSHANLYCLNYQKKELVVWEDIAIYLVCSVLEVSRFIDGIRVSVLAVYERF